MFIPNAHYHSITTNAPTAESLTAASVRSARSRRQALWIGLVVFALAFVFYAGNGVQPTIFDDNEGLYAGAVREMTQSGDWLLPTNNGLPRVQKPPLTYWPMLVSTAVLGMNEFAIRLPNAFFTAAWVYATFLIGARLRDTAFGVTAAAILSTMIGVFVFTHLVQPEPYLATFISLSIYAVINAVQDPRHRRKWYLAAWTCLALGTLSKGLHGAFWPIGIIGASMLFLPRYRSGLKGFFHWSGPVLFLALVVPWYIYMELRLPGFLQAHFLREQVSAAVDSKFDRETLSIPVWMFYLQHLIFFAPWVLFAPAAGWAWNRERIELAGKEKFSQPWDIVWMWAVVTFGSLTFFNLQDYYAMTCWGVAALWLAKAFHSHTQPPRWLLGVPCVLLAVAGSALLVFAVFFKSILMHGSQHIAPIAERDTFANALAGISLGVWQSFLPLMLAAGLALLLGGGAAAGWLWRSKPQTAMAVGALTLVTAVLCCLATDGFRIMSPNFSLAEIGRSLNASASADTIVVCEGAPHQSSSLLFYLNRRIHWVNAPSQREFAVRVQGKGTELYFDEARFLETWNSAQPMALIVEDEHLAKWQEKLSHTNYPPHVMLHSGTRNVLVKSAE